MDVTKIGDKIKKRRAALDITQKDLAKEINVSGQLISKWETGESVPSLEYLDALCKALRVDFSYFTSDDESNDKQTEAARPAAPAPRKRKTFKWNWKLFAIIASAVSAAVLVAVLTVLSIFVFVPAANRNRYLNAIEKAGDDYFAQGYYSIIAKTELDGDVKDDYRYNGYFDENGKPVFHDTKYKLTVKDDILTFDSGEYKYRFVSEKKYQTLEELALSIIDPKDEDDDEKKDEDVLKQIKYIRKVKGGYYLEMKKSYFIDDLTGTQKKNYKLTDKIKGKIEIKDGLCSSMEVTVKYLNKPDNERFTIRVSFEFVAEKPVIEHKNLQSREWNGTYIGNQWYPSASSGDPGLPVPDIYECDTLLSTEDLFHRLSAGTAIKLETDDDFKTLILNGQIKDGGAYYYYFQRGIITILNRTDLSVKTTIDLGNEAHDVYVYNGYVFWIGYNDFYRMKNINYGWEDLPLGDTKPEEIISYNGGYALYYGRKPNSYSNSYNVIDLEKREVINSCSKIAYDYMDSAGNVYCTQQIDGVFVPAVYKKNQCTILKGTDFYRRDGKIVTDSDSVFTAENGTVYRYENGELKEQLTSADPRLKKDYIRLSNGCYADGNIYDKNGEGYQIGAFKLKSEAGEWETKYGYTSLVDVVNGKLLFGIDKYGGYLAVCDDSNAAKPLYYMKKPTHYWSGDEVKIIKVGKNTIAAVRINTTDYYAYELYYF